MPPRNSLLHINDINDINDFHHHHHRHWLRVYDIDDHVVFCDRDRNFVAQPALDPRR